MTSPSVRSEEAVLLRRDEAGVTTLTLNRPHHRNALNDQLLGQLQSALDDIAAERSVRVVVMAGAGPAFCAGHDLKQMRDQRREESYEELFRRCSEVMLSIVRLPQPVIARVHGIATAAGCQLVASCDLAVAASPARFAVSGINVGLFCGTPAVALSRNIARKQAFEMLVTGDFIDAPTALRYGLVNRVVDADQLDEEVAALSTTLLSKSPAAIQAGKAMFYRQLEMGINDAYEYANNTMARGAMMEDACEGIDAFLDRGRPRGK